MSEWNFLVNTAIPVLISVIPWMIKVHAKLAVVEHQIKELCGKLESNAATIRDFSARSNELSARIVKLEEHFLLSKRRKNHESTRPHQGISPDSGITTPPEPEKLENASRPPEECPQGNAQ